MTPAQAIAAVAPVAEAILPRTSSPLQRALLAAELARIAAVNPRVIADIWHPWRCPARLLPFLAAAVSVDVWDDGWSIIEKRREIALSPRLHRLKGTRWAVEAAAERLGLPISIIEWWETTPPARRGTFRVIADVATLPVTPELRARLVERVDLAKPKSRVFDDLLAVYETGRIGIASATRTESIIVADPFTIAGDAEEEGPLGLAAATWTRSTIFAGGFDLPEPEVQPNAAKFFFVL